MTAHLHRANWSTCSSSATKAGNEFAQRETESGFHDATLGEALVEMSRKRLGMTAVVDDAGRLAGLFTDGDLRRALDAGTDVRMTPIAEVMTVAP